MIAVRFDISKRGQLSRSVDCKLPSKFDELTADDLLLLCHNMTPDFTIVDFKMLLLHKYSGLNKKDYVLLNENRNALSELFNEINIDVENVRSNRNILPTAEVEGKTYHGMHGDFGNVRFVQWAFAELYFNLFSMSQDVQHLKLLADVIYLGPEYVFDKSKIDEYNLRFANADESLLNAIGICYSAMRREFYDNNTEIFPKPIAQKATSTAEPFDPKQYQNLIDWVAKTKYFGDYGATENQFIPDVINYLKNCKEEKTNVTK